MNPEQAARRWQQAKIARQRRDVELETFPTTAGSDAKTSHPMFGTGRPSSPSRARLPGLARRLPTPAGLTVWGTIGPAAIEHVGGGYYLVACIVLSEDAGWYDGEHVRWATAVWLIRPNHTISNPWVSDGHTARPYTQGPFTGDAFDAPPYGEPSYLSLPKLTRWQEGALLSFTVPVFDRQYVSDTAGYWPQYVDTELDVPFAANVYRWIGHDGTDPVIGPPYELYAGLDTDFPTKGDWTNPSTGLTEHDDGTVEGFEVIAPSADPNIAVYGLTYNSGWYRVWLLDKNPADNTLSLAQRTTFDGALSIRNPDGLTRIAADRWVAMGDRFGAEGGIVGVLFNAKTGTVVDSAVWDVGSVFVYDLPAALAYYATNHLHFTGTGVFAGWYRGGGGVFEGRYTTLTVEADTLVVGPIGTWDDTGDLLYGSARFVETCEGCLRLVSSSDQRGQGLFERGQLKAGPAGLSTPEFEYGGTYDDQRVVPSSHPAGSMWAVNVSKAAAAYGTDAQVEPWLVRYPA